MGGGGGRRCGEGWWGRVVGRGGGEIVEVGRGAFCVLRCEVWVGARRACWGTGVGYLDVCVLRLLHVPLCLRGLRAAQPFGAPSRSLHWVRFSLGWYLQPLPSSRPPPFSPPALLPPYYRLQLTPLPALPSFSLVMASFGLVFTTPSSPPALHCTGHLPTFHLLQSLSARRHPAQHHVLSSLGVGYGAHCAVSLALGFLFMGAGESCGGGGAVNTTPNNTKPIENEGSAGRGNCCKR